MEPTVEDINKFLKNYSRVGEVSDGYHTFNELYEHRIELYLCLCEIALVEMHWLTLLKQTFDYWEPEEINKTINALYGSRCDVVIDNG